MSFRSLMIVSSALALFACSGTAGSAKAPLPAHQAEAAPAPQRTASAPSPGPDKDRPSEGKAKTRLSFDIPPSWKQAPEEAVKAPWKAAFIRADMHGMILMDFNPHSSDAAPQAAKEVHDGICAENHWDCDDVVVSADGTTASFTLSSDEDTRGKITFRDLDGPARSQLELFGLWPKERETEAVKDMQTMISTAAVK